MTGGWFWSAFLGGGCVQMGKEDEKGKRVRNKCKADISALHMCTRAYSDEVNTKACDTLRNQVLYCYNQQYNTKAALNYEKCFHQAVTEGSYITDQGKMACEKEVRQMQRALRRARALPCDVL